MNNNIPLIEDNEFYNMPLEEKVNTICSYMSLPALTPLQMQRINLYIEAYHQTLSDYATQGNDNKQIEEILKRLTIPMNAAQSIMNDGNVHPAVDMLINSEKVGGMAFEKSYQRVRKNPSAPKLFEDDEMQKAGYGVTMIILLVVAGLSLVLTWLYFVLKMKAGL